MWETFSPQEQGDHQMVPTSDNGGSQSPDVTFTLPPSQDVCVSLVDISAPEVKRVFQTFRFARGGSVVLTYQAAAVKRMFCY